MSTRLGCWLVLSLARYLRLLPVGAFEKEVMSGQSRNAIQINITGVGDVDVSGGTTIDGEIVDDA